MKTLIAAALIAGAASAAPAQEHPGFASIDIPSEHHEAPMEGAVWYPAGTGGQPLAFGENPVFVGVPVRDGASVAEGRFPLVVLSHGLGGNLRTLGWLAAGLAEKGAVVAAVNHPGSTTGDFEMALGLDHGTRVADLEAAIDELTSDPRFGPHVDSERIYAAGFSLGGWTALSIGGLTGNLAAYAITAKRSGRPPPTAATSPGRASISTPSTPTAGIAPTRMSASREWRRSIPGCSTG